MRSRLTAVLQQLDVAPEAAARFMSALQPAQTFKSGGVIARAGGRATYLHLLESGWACRTRSLRGERRQIVALTLAGEICDLESVASSAHDSTVVALVPSRVHRAPLSVVRSLIEEEPSLCSGLQRLTAVERLIATEWMVSLGRRSALERIAFLLCETAARLVGAPDSGSVCFPFPMTQADLADAAGLSVVHVNRSLQALKRQAGVVFEKRSATVPDWAELVEIAGFDPAYLGPLAAPGFPGPGDFGRPPLRRTS